MKARCAPSRREKRLGPDVLNGGYQIYTTLDSSMQNAANQAVVKGLVAYDRRHGWRGAEARLDLAQLDEKALQTQLQPFWTVNGLVAGVVTRVDASTALVRLGDQGRTTGATTLPAPGRHLLNAQRR